MWSKFIRYRHLHEVNPDKYPIGRVPVEMSEFIANLKDIMFDWFGEDSILDSFCIFIWDNPILVFLLAVGLAFCSLRLIKYALQISARM